ncbi:hypothetical protein UT300011_24650 [Clostridium perfringens]
MKKICIIGQFPPPLHGLSKALDTLYNSKLKNEFNFEKVDITNNKKIIKNIIKIIKNNSDIFYLTISQTKVGNIRDLVLLKILQLRKKKTIVHLHGGYYRNLIEKDVCSLQKYLNFRIMKNVSAAIVLGDLLSNIFDGIIEKERIYIVPNCVDNKFLISNVEFKNKIDTIDKLDRLNIIYLSNFIESKGYKEVLEVARYAKYKGDDRFKFKFAGKFFSEIEKKEFFNYIDKNDLEEIVEYKGIVDGKEKKDLLIEGNIFILLTRYPKEGQPISIIEAKGNGLVTITTNHAGILDLMSKEEENLGCIINDVYNYKYILELLNNLYKNREDFKKVVIRNRKEVLDKYTENNYLEKLRYVFISVLDQK